MKMEVVVSFQFEAVHRWPKAKRLPAVSYLRHPHRHVFHVRAWKAVGHEDRDIEIITLKNELQHFVSSTFHGDLRTGSCEKVARLLVQEFDLARCEVLEDGENGAVVEAA